MPAHSPTRALLAPTRVLFAGIAAAFVSLLAACAPPDVPSRPGVGARAQAAIATNGMQSSPGMWGMPGTEATVSRSMACTPMGSPGDVQGRTVCAHVVALDQALVYNRFGSFNPFGMMFALARDLSDVAVAPERIDADQCGATLGTEAGVGPLAPGKVRLKDCKRPRPLVLRANPGDLLHLKLTNLLRPEAPDFSADFCSRRGHGDGGGGGDSRSAANAASAVSRALQELRRWVSYGDAIEVDHGEAACLDRTEVAAAARGAGQASGLESGGEHAGRQDDGHDDKQSPQRDGNWPASRGLNFAIQGLQAVGSDGMPESAHQACLGLRTIPTGESIDCRYRVEREGTFFLTSTAAPSGGEGDGGSITHGLFGAVVVEPKGSRWYRSQVTRAAFDTVWRAQGSVPHARRPSDVTDAGRYAEQRDGVPILDMLQKHPSGAYELVHSDLNAIVQPAGEGEDGRAFREFSVFFHDELKSFATRNFEELDQFGQLAGVRDGFAINYGASGMGAILLANRKGIGPSATCQECLYEEFFLTSWANGDPALLESYSDDPSNVHHSYLNDKTVFRNFHAGPKETHVFHLHAHQWFSGNDSGRGSYLDSQTVAPQQGFTYDVYGGGLAQSRPPGVSPADWIGGNGSGNRNRTIGDSIFHCHLYPHFAQGMWALWRVHDVLEDGTRVLPDGQLEPGLSLAEVSDAAKRLKRPGSVDPVTGRRIIHGGPAGAGASRFIGTPIPAIVPLPGQAWPLLPTYPEDPVAIDPQQAPEQQAAARAVPPSGSQSAQPAAVRSTPDEVVTMPGYPFYIAGRPGHRPPQAPMDLALAAEDLKAGGDGPVVIRKGQPLDGGLPRHVVTDEAIRELSVKPDQDMAPAPASTTQAEALASDASRKRERQQAQAVARILALGDMTAHLPSARLELLDAGGTPLERAAMGFHHDGTRWQGPGEGSGDRAGKDAVESAGEGAAEGTGASSAGASSASPGKALVLRQADGQPAVRRSGGYTSTGAGPTGRGPSGAGLSGSQTLFRVNGAPPKPGAPFADPCGVPAPEAGDEAAWKLRRGADPLLGGVSSFYFDPQLIGFRRYEASAVQVDLVTNRAGWHDPQGRINVLTALSDGYKKVTGQAGTEMALRQDGVAPGRFTPRISAVEEPFFFRALSGECIEFRHTNELPKDLELDDFQVRTPTDTIGQHIHLVKFDVTASDGSANGFNYEDGTFAPDEVAARICAARSAGMETVGLRLAGSPVPQLVDAGRCEPVAGDPNGRYEVGEAFKDIWRRQRSASPHLFQTTIQRWFADPILSPQRAKGDGDEAVGPIDRTMRTVFSHDHFGPSSIQQHGFYSALVIEPTDAIVCDPAPGAVRPSSAASSAGGTPPGFKACDRDAVTELVPAILADASKVRLRHGTADLVGTKKVISRPNGPSAHTDPYDINYREFALAIADFATLYDPRDTETAAQFEQRLASRHHPARASGGMETLLCEAMYAHDPGRMHRRCGSALAQADGAWFAGVDVPPAWKAAGRPGDHPGHRADLLAWKPAVLGEDIDRLRRHLLGWRRMAAGFAADDASAPLARPVNAPARPESISVDHHDPYLVNYRGEPLPLRIGQGTSDQSCALLLPEEWAEKLSTGVRERCSVRTQRKGGPGDLANVFRSSIHGDPATPVFESYGGDRAQFRLIQGAQEVQHTFNLEGAFWPRNIDQRFPSQARRLDGSADGGRTLTSACAASVPGESFPLEPGRGGRPDEYRRWQLRSSDLHDTPYWKAYERWIAECPNVEGILAAQEIGISEHFEFSGVFRQETIGAELDLKDSPDAMPTDSLLHFGSQDALWNGAWSLLRVYRNKDAKAPGPGPLPCDSTLLSQECERRVEQAPSAGTHLAPLRRPDEADVATGWDKPVCSPGEPGSPGAPEVRATVVAIDVASVFGPFSPGDPGGTPYGRRLRDPDGLFLALVGAEGAPTMDRQALIEQIRHRYLRPEPLVLHVNAGDCVRLTVVNALDGRHGSSPRGLRDGLGDAPMPRITPLNVEPAWSQDEGGGEGKGEGEGANEEVDDYRVYRQADRSNVQPSAKLALGIDLPLIDHPQKVSRPFGYNLTGGLEPMPARGAAAGADGGSRHVETLTYYAGRLAVAPDSSSQHWIPYAFGPVAIRPVGDMISQVSHGLFGAIVVHPRQAAFDPDAAGQGRIEKACQAPPESSASAEVPVRSKCHVLDRIQTASLASAVYVARHGDRAHRVRYQTLFFQDGLNLHDLDTRDRFHGRDTPTHPPSRPPLMADCAHCDDSYDQGDTGVSYRSAPFHVRLRSEPGLGSNRPPERHFNLNHYEFGRGFFLTRPDEQRPEGQPLEGRPREGRPFEGQPEMPVVRAEAGEEVMFGVVHPGGRARQRSFAFVGQHYYDLFPGFGFPNAALLAPGKAVTAALSTPVSTGCYLWYDGTATLRSGGAWGLLDVRAEGRYADDEESRCRR